MPPTKTKNWARVATFLFSLALHACGGSPTDAGGGNPDVTPPIVTDRVPPANATGVLVGTTITVTFSEEMQAGMFTTASFNLTPTVAGTVSYSGTTATFTPAAPLAFGTEYIVTVAGSLRDLAGNSLGASVFWSFTTVADGAPLANVGAD